MASPNNPTSSADLIRRHSKARVVHASKKSFQTGINALGNMTYSRSLTDADVRESLVRQHR
jgi:hypothetical protein